MRVAATACVLGLALVAWAGTAARTQRVDLVDRAWTRNGVAAEVAADGDSVALPMDGAGVRWATVFDAGTAHRARITLHWEGGPDGLLFEVVIDGERLVPARDGWRPSRRPLVSDLGSVWLGEGGHLLEFVAREETEGVVRVVALELERLEGGGGR